MYQRILVPVDGSPTSNAGLAEAIKLAKPTGARVQVLHVVGGMPFTMSADGYGAMPGDVFTMLKEAGQAVLEQGRVTVDAAGIPVEATLFDSASRLCDRVAEQVQEWSADVIVLGTHGRRGVGRMLLGSDAEQIVRTATVPVLLVRGTPSEADHSAATASTRARFEPT
jgi:nucleotide-binding universal stress UspA family protein